MTHSNYLPRLALALGSLGLLSSLATGQGFDPPDAVDLDPDATVVEVNIEAAITVWQFIPGVDTTVYAYNGSVPGPTIRANVGDTLKVHFTNNLPEPTTIHWHGLDIPADQDGSHIAQGWVQPGETYDYEFVLPQEGMFWYHPHVNTADVVERGLHGVLLVHDPVVEAGLNLLGVEEHIVVFDDIALDDDEQILPAFYPTDPLAKALYQLNGRVGNHLLINGRLAGTNNLTVTNGAPQRWRVVNVANTTFCRLDINDPVDGVPAPLWQIGTDGGLLTRRYTRPPVTDPSSEHVATMGWDRQGIFLTPGERMDVVFTPYGPAGYTFKVLQKDWPRGRHMAMYDSMGNIMLPDDPLDGIYPAQEFLSVTLSGPNPGGGYYQPPADLVTFTRPDEDDAVGMLMATLGHTMPDGNGDTVSFAQAKMVDDGMGGMMMMGLPSWAITSYEAQDVSIGETWIWEITNMTHMDHPFHTHGFFFYPYEVQYYDLDAPANNWRQVIPYPQRKDTIRVPARTGARMRSKTVVRAVVTFDDTGREGRTAAHGETATFRPDGSHISGGWLFHCHLLEHAARGMLSYIEVRDPADPYWLLGHSLSGANGKPSLTATGDLTAGAAINFELVNGIPNGRTFFVAGLSAANTPMFGGIMVPEMDLVNGTKRVDPNGRVTWNVNWSSVLVSGAEVWVQVAVRDITAPMGYSFSNAVKVVVP